MRVVRVQVESKKSIMLSATGDASFSVRLEAELSPEESDGPKVQQIVQGLQATADWLVDQHMALQKRG